jgi:hypothetical protein
VCVSYSQNEPATNFYEYCTTIFCDFISLHTAIGLPSSERANLCVSHHPAATPHHIAKIEIIKCGFSFRSLSRCGSNLYLKLIQSLTSKFLCGSNLGLHNFRSLSFRVISSRIRRRGEEDEEQEELNNRTSERTRQ